MIAVRAAREEDAVAIAAIYAPHVTVGTASFEVEAPDAAEMRRRMMASDGLYPWMVATDGDNRGATLGYAYASAYHRRPAYRWTAETTVYVADAARRRGVGRRLYATLIATLQAQGFTQAIGAIALPNESSIALHETAGFRRVGVIREVGHKAGQWVDVGYWQRGLAGPTTPPREPRRFADVGVVSG